MIDTILFDMGSVLVRFEPAEFIARRQLSPEDSETLLHEVFRSADWVRLDRGSMTHEEAIAAMVKLRDTFVPDEEEHGLYRRIYEEVYSKYYKTVTPLHKRLGELTKRER